MKKFLIKRFTFLLILCFFASTNSNAQEFKNSLQEEGLNGNVKSTTIRDYTASGTADNIQNKVLQGTNLRTYDKRGNITENFNGVKTEYVYDSYGNKLLEEAYPNKYSFEYDNKGNMIKSTVLGGFGTGDYKTYAYDKDDHLVEMTLYNYNSALNTFEKTDLHKYQYDTKARLVGETQYKNNVEHKKTIYKFDVNGNLVETVVYYRGQLAESTLFKFDNKKNKIEKSFNYLLGNNKYRLTYKYDVKGNVLEESHYDRNNEILTINQKTYDSQNNWTKSIELIRDDKVVSLIERTIVYY